MPRKRQLLLDPNNRLILITNLIQTHCFPTQLLLKMPQGILEVVIAGATGLENTDFLSGIDAYAVVTCHGQEKRSKVASGQGSTPAWKETFLFDISGGVNELKIRIMDKDMLTADDFVGEAIIPLGPVFDEESIPTTSYNVSKDENYCGVIIVGLKFTHQRRSREISVGELGGWRSSSMD